MKPKQAKPPWNERLLFELGGLPDAASREKYLNRHPALLKADVITQLTEMVRERVRVDTQQALGLAEAAMAIAQRIGDRGSLAHSFRAKANALYASGQNQSAAELHERACGLFQAVGNMAEVGRTLSTSMQPLILLGEYDRALAAAEQARQIFAQQGEVRRLARLEINRGNVFHRQDRFPEALDCYERALQELSPDQDAEGIAVALSNMAVCLMSLNDFPRALVTHQRARAICEQHGMPLLVAQADYNVAYLFYLRGEYSRAIGMLREAREACQKVGDHYHSALCLLDLSEIYLDLNLSGEAAEVAQEAYARFGELKLGYEAAKALTYHAIALSKQEKAFRALELFGQARAMFVQEKNLVWPWLIDLYQALVFSEEGRLFEARRLCVGALEFFRSSSLASKTVLCHLLLARLALRSGDTEGARRDCALALERLSALQAPSLRYQAHFLMGQIQEASGSPEEAYASYHSAREALEGVLGSQRGEELKIPFLKNKLEVYEALVGICVSGKGGQASAEEAFGYIEQAKMRRVSQLLFQGIPIPPSGDLGQSALVRRIRDLREELNWYYHRIEIEELEQKKHSLGRIAQLQEQTRIREQEFLQALQELPSSESEGVGLHPSPGVTVEALRAALAPATALVEYFQVEGRLLAVLVTKETLEIVPLTLMSRVKGLLEMLRAQLSKFSMDSGPGVLHKPHLQAIQAHLHELYQGLLAPLLERWQGQHLIFAPYDVLHDVPFHSLYDGRQYLIDSCTVSYAPSATLYAHCHAKSACSDGASLILGVPDPHVPFILEEVQSVAATLPRPELFLGDAASPSVLREKGRRSRFVHIAARGDFHRDNPMFSGIRLGSSSLPLRDLYQMNLPAELVTLSDWAPSLNASGAGNELLGLVRALLYAGAQSLLVALWEVHDRSTAEFMKVFYTRLLNSGEKPAALQEAMVETRERYPHPYHWAPFLLVGKIFPS